MIDAAVALAGIVFVAWLAAKQRLARRKRMIDLAARPLGWHWDGARWRYGRLPDRKFRLDGGPAD